MMRLFVAIWVPERVIESLPLPVLREAIARQGVRFTQEHKIHLTLRFLGNVLDEDVEPLTVRLAERLAGMTSKEVAVRGLGAFPNETRPGTVWVGVHGNLEPLHDAVVSASDQVAERPAERVFIPHLTLARISPPSQKVGRALEPLIREHRETSFGSWIPDEVVLVRTLSDGSYERIAEIPLIAAGEQS